MFALLALTMSVLVLLGVLGAPLLVSVIAPGFTGAKRELTVRLVRVLFPGAGLLVASAWCLGVLNSHGKFLLSYTAPVAWNAAMIATLVAFGPRHELERAGDVSGLGIGRRAASSSSRCRRRSALRLSRRRWRALDDAPVRQAVRNFVPVLISRGAVQLTGYIDAMIASLLPTGAVTGLTNAQLLYTLPVSLFGVAISAAELPAMSGDASRDAGPEGRFVALATPHQRGLDASGVFRRAHRPSRLRRSATCSRAHSCSAGGFEPRTRSTSWGILAGSSIGLLATRWRDCIRWPTTRSATRSVRCATPWSGSSR